MKYIYVDEAGVQDDLKSAVVAGVVIDADKQWKETESALERAISECVPVHMRDGFVFHAKSIWGSKKLRAEWPSQEERVQFLKRVMSIPRDVGLTLCTGVVHPFAVRPVIWGDMNDCNYRHMMAFKMCCERADFFMRKYAPTDEVATMICEDVDQIKSTLRTMFKVLKRSPYVVPLSRDEQYAVEVSRIVDVPHFVKKDESPMLQLADACAYAFRRYLSREPLGEDYMYAVIGKKLPDAWFTNATSGGIFRLGS